ncbi:MAG TPA: hypothetical protein VFZ22_11615 [Pyrinomonadaceae bacterium]|nr:hypothetical protein [Pyrinomonadaceae bacterium]
MKRCPQCYGVYQNTETYCEVDGQRLLADPVMPVKRGDLVPDAPQSTRNYGAVATGLIGVLTGVILCSAAYLTYSFLTAGAEQPQSDRRQLAAQVQDSQTRTAPARAPEALPSPSESPTEEEEAEASPEPSQSPAEPAAAAKLNYGPVSTGNHASTADGEKTIIEMQDGSKVEVDAAWKDNQGVWYRQGSLVSFVEGPRVKSITARAEPKSSPVANQ